MTPSARARFLPLLLLPVAAAWFLAGIDWGLPSRRVDPYLFGTHPVWTGAEIQQKAEAAAAGATSARWNDPSRGADVDSTPLGRSSIPIQVNATDAQRAEIIRRYRLYTYQPDEMITMMSLAKMRPGQLDFDPRLYQYGGLWVYPVGGMLVAGSKLGLIQLRTGPNALTWYLDHPEAFGRFYVAARLYVVLWGLVGVVAVYRIVREVQWTVLAAIVAAAAFAMMPVVVNMAHEAKPHLPGAVLALLATLAGARYARTGRWRDALGAGALCGAAFGMVLSMLPAFAILGVMTLLRPLSWGRRAAVAVGAAAVGGIVYGLTNPYVVIHQFWHREVFQSNLSNSTAMYQDIRPLAGLVTEASLISEGMSPLLAICGIVGAGFLGVRAYHLRADRSPAEVRRRATGLLLATPALLMLAQFAALGAGKPGEYGRFLLLPNTFLMIEAVVAAGTFFRSLGPGASPLA